MIKINVNNFNLKDTITCGQIFRYEVNDDNSYTVVIKDRVIKLWYKDNILYVKVKAYIRIVYYENGKLVPYNVEDGFESKHIKTILYDGIMNTEDDAKYKIEVPSLMPEINNTRITEAILNIARKYMK